MPRKRDCIKTLRFEKMDCASGITHVYKATKCMMHPFSHPENSIATKRSVFFEKTDNETLEYEHMMIMATYDVTVQKV